MKRSRYIVRKNRKRVDNPGEFPWVVFDLHRNEANWCYSSKKDADEAAQRLNEFEDANNAQRWMLNYRLKYMQEER